MDKNYPLTSAADEEWRQIFLKVKTELTTHLAPGETLPDDLEQETWEIHNELNSMAQQKASACIDRFRQLLHGVIGPVTPDHLTELMNEEIALFLPSGFLQPDYCHTTCKERVRARQELSELPVDTDELNVARYALLRKLVENKNGSLLIDKARGICYVYNKWEDLTPKAKRDFVRFGYMLRLINDKLTELVKMPVEEEVECKAVSDGTLQPAPVEEEKLEDNEQPVNLVFKKFHEGKAIDFIAIRKCIEEKLVCDIKRQYEWYAAYRIADDLKLLEDLKLTSFTDQMNKWFPDAEVPCDTDALGDYATGHTAMNYSRWDEETFMAEKKNNQTQKGFRKLWILCHEMKDAIKNIPTLPQK